MGISYGFSAISACGNHADPWWSGSDRGWHETAFAITEYSPQSARPSFRRTGAVKPCGVSKQNKLSVPSAHFDASRGPRSHKGKGTYSPTINCSSKWGEEFFPHSHYSTREKPTRATSRLEEETGVSETRRHVQERKPLTKEPRAARGLKCRPRGFVSKEPEPTPKPQRLSFGPIPHVNV